LGSLFWVSLSVLLVCGDYNSTGFLEWVEVERLVLVLALHSRHTKLSAEQLRCKGPARDKEEVQLSEAVLGSFCQGMDRRGTSIFCSTVSFYLHNLLCQDPSNHGTHRGHLREAVPRREDKWGQDS
jgi:hypothetical protein